MRGGWRQLAEAHLLRPAVPIALNQLARACTLHRPRGSEIHLEIELIGEGRFRQDGLQCFTGRKSVTKRISSIAKRRTIDVPATTTVFPARQARASLLLKRRILHVNGWKTGPSHTPSMNWFALKIVQDFNILHAADADKLDTLARAERQRWHGR